MLWVGHFTGVAEVVIVLHPSCKIPMNPAHGRWNCDVEKSGTTVCLLECDPQFAIKGSHIIECDLKQETFDPDPVQSVCAEAKIRYDYDFKRKLWHELTSNKTKFNEILSYFTKLKSKDGLIFSGLLLTLPNIFTHFSSNNYI